MCISCIANINKKEEEKREVQIYAAYVTFDENEKPLCFKNKDDAIDYMITEMKKILQDEDSYDDDGDFKAPQLHLGFITQKLRN